MTSDVAAPRPLDLVGEPQLDFGDLQDRLASLLDRHDYGRQRWTYADLLDQLGERRLQGMTHALGHDLVPMEDLQQAWRAGRGPIRPEHARAPETAYLGEANLPWYTENLAHHFAAAAPQLSDFFHRWVAEEDQHSRAFELYLLFDRAVPAEEMLTAKSALLQAGRDVPAAGPFRLLVYTSVQELSTRVFYARLAAAVGADDQLLVELLRRVQADESLHLAFYRDAAKAALQQQPSLAATALDEIRRFREPVTVLPDYEARKEQIWRTGISNLTLFRTHVIAPLLKHWNLDVDQVRGRW